ncbi:MAG: class I SAM-dependent methyltransferase [Desulfobacca sp.]|uniref:class I SAM-dependent methyltransferase n=1 Tax=Desulfobacca sp. TaxID=2067990 RepID=UPI00404A5823
MLTDEAAQRLYEDLARRYHLAWADIQVGPIRLKLLQLADLESYLVAHIEAQQLSLENFPYWAMVWDGALVLADFLVKQPPQPGHTILELGAGLGFASLAAAARGHQATMTDNNADALAFARLSAWRNNLANVRVEYLDWYNPQLTGQFSWLVAADILYEPATFAPLLQVFGRYVQPGGKIYLTQGIRGRGPQAFFELAKPLYHIRFQEKKLRQPEGDRKILFFELTPK